MSAGSGKGKAGPTSKKAGTGAKKDGMGKALRHVFHAEEILKGIEPQPATTSYLMSPVRRAIFLHLCESPCDHVRGIARAVGKSPPATTWHLNILCDVGLLDSEFVSRKRVFWPKGMVRKSDAPTIALLRRPELVRAVGAVAGNDGISERDLVKKLKVKQQNLNVWLKLLCGANILKKTGRGRGTTYSISAKFAKLIEEYDGKARKHCQLNLKTLEKDGLRPKKPVFRGSGLTVTVSLPSGKEKIRLECNPLAEVRLTLK